MAILLAPPGLTLTSAYVIRWLAVAALLLAHVGRRRFEAALAVATAVGLAAAYIGYLEAPHLRAGPLDRWPYFAGAIVIVCLSAVQLTRWITERKLIDPVNLVALQIGVGVVARWTYFLVSRQGLNPLNYGPDTFPAQLRSELPLLAIALAAVGLGVTRSAAPAIRRLGFVRFRWWHIGVAILVAQVLLFAAAEANHLTFLLMPAAWTDIRLIEQRAFSPLPVGALLASAFLAGVCEETLFRGALQPKTGILIAAALFAMLHVQYGLTPIVGMVFLHGAAFGLLRRYVNTTTAVMTHFLYDAAALFAVLRTFSLLWAVAMGVALAIPAWQNRDAIVVWARSGFPAPVA